MESKPTTQFSDYPANLFEESRDHANQWDVSELFQKQEEKKTVRPTHFTDYPVNLFEESRDHANQWDMAVLLQTHEKKKTAHADQA